jgi:hypothetical protein
MIRPPSRRAGESDGDQKQDFHRGRAPDDRGFFARARIRRSFLRVVVAQPIQDDNQTGNGNIERRGCVKRAAYA